MLVPDSQRRQVYASLLAPFKIFLCRFQTPVSNSTTMIFMKKLNSEEACQLCPLLLSDYTFDADLLSELH